MDILVSSNLERLLYFLSKGDCELVASYMDSLTKNGSYTVSDSILQNLKDSFSCGFADDDATRKTISSTWNDLSVLIDTHTAVAKAVLDGQESEGRPRVCLSTASPYKFSADVLAALGAQTEGLDGFACMDELERLTGTSAPVQLSSLRSAAELHTSVCDQNEMEEFVGNACARVFL